MTDKPTFWKPTAEMYTKLFNKPPMSEKLLSRPPFKYIFDVVMALMDKTGFPQGLFSKEELDVSIYNNKETKMRFLQKLIDCVQLVNGTPLSVKTSKIVAGQEAEKTNEWLQAMYIAATSKKDFKPAIQKVLNVKSTDTEDKKKPEKPRAEETHKSEAQTVETTDKVPTKKKPSKERQKRESPQEKKPPSPKNIEQKKEPKKVEPEPVTVPNVEGPSVTPNVDIDSAAGGKFVEKTKEKIAKDQAARVNEETTKKTEIKKKTGGIMKIRNTGKKRHAIDGERVPHVENMDDVEYLRTIIQNMTRTIAPLGKSMDFISEDIEIMTKEYENWKSRSQAAKIQLEEELKRTDDVLQPLYDKLAEIETHIQEQKEKIHNTKSQIFKNEGMIQGLLNSIISK